MLSSSADSLGGVLRLPGIGGPCTCGGGCSDAGASVRGCCSQHCQTVLLPSEGIGSAVGAGQMMRARVGGAVSLSCGKARMLTLRQGMGRCTCLVEHLLVELLRLECTLSGKQPSDLACGTNRRGQGSKALAALHRRLASRAYARKLSHAGPTCNVLCNALGFGCLGRVRVS